MDTLSFETAMRVLIDDAPSNFARFRRANRRPADPVMTEFDVGLVVEGAYDTYVSLLDYDLPRVHVALYCGNDLAAADLTFDVSEKRLSAFSTGSGERSEVTQDSEHTPMRWLQTTYRTPRGVWVTATQVSYQPMDSELREYTVRVEVAGREIECIHGFPEDSPWHIVFANSPLCARTGKPPDPGDRKRRERLRHTRARDS